MRLVLVVVAGVALWVSGGGQAAVPGRAGRIAFVTERVIARGAVVSVRPDATGRVTLAPTGTDSSPVVVSSRGSELAWADGGKLDVARGDGSDVRNLGDAWAPSFAPDGSRLAARVS